MLNLGNTSLATTLDIQTEIRRLKEVNLTLLGKEVELETKITKEKNTQKDISTAFLADDSEEAIERTISKLTALRKTVSINSAAYNTLGFQIKTLQTILDGLTGKLDKAAKKQLDLTNATKESISAFKAFMKEVLALQKALEKELTDLESGFINDIFADADLSFIGSLITDFERIELMLEEGGNKWEDYFLLISEGAQEVFNLLSKFSQQSFENELTSLEKKYTISTKFAGDNADAKEEIDRQYEEKRAKIQARQAKAEKEQAIFNTVINTAQGIVATIGQVGFPAAIPLIVAIGAIGAAQLALINSQSIPEFKDGVVGFSGGLAKVNDAKGSNYKEIIKTPDGKLSMAKGRNALVDLPKGTDVIKASETDSFMRNMYNELALNDIMPFSNSFGASIMPNINANGITKAEIQDVMSKELSKVSNVIKNKSETTLSIDENGINAFSYNNGQKRKMLNARVRRNGRKV